MVDLASDYATKHLLVFNSKKTVFTIVNKPKCAISDLKFDGHIIQPSDRFIYLGIHFIAGKDLSVDIAHVRRKFHVASNSIITRSHGLAEPVRVQLFKSFCLPLLAYCIGALKLKRSMIHELSVCWNNVLDVFFLLRNGNPSKFCRLILEHLIHAFV